MAFDSLTDKLQNVFKKLRSKGTLTEDDVKEYNKYFKKMTEKYTEYSRELTSVYTDNF